MKLNSKSIIKRKIPFYGMKVFLPPKIRNKSQQNEQSPGNTEPYESGLENDAGFVITGVSFYAQAAQKPPAACNKTTTSETTYWLGDHPSKIVIRQL